jgi:hypothetical protein
LAERNKRLLIRARYEVRRRMPEPSLGSPPVPETLPEFIPATKRVWD